MEMICCFSLRLGVDRQHVSAWGAHSTEDSGQVVMVWDDLRGGTLGLSAQGLGLAHRLDWCMDD